MTAIGRGVKLSEQLPRLLQRLEILEPTPEVEQARHAVAFAIEQFPQQTPSMQMRYVLGNFIFVGDIEHQQLLDLRIAQLNDQASRAKAARALKQAPAWHALCVAKARVLLKHGQQRHQISGTLAQLFRKGPKAVREVLKKAGVLT